MDKIEKQREKLKAQADALLYAGDALSQHFPAESKRLLRWCRELRLKARDLKNPKIS